MLACALAPFLISGLDPAQRNVLRDQSPFGFVNGLTIFTEDVLPALSTRIMLSIVKGLTCKTSQIVKAITFEKIGTNKRIIKAISQPPPPDSHIPLGALAVYLFSN
jgi:hypothetical protein